MDDDIKRILVVSRMTKYCQKAVHYGVLPEKALSCPGHDLVGRRHQSKRTGGQVRYDLHDNA